MDMEKNKKSIESVAGLAMLSVVLVVAIVALFVMNSGFGWLVITGVNEANGMTVTVDESSSPLVKFEFCRVGSSSIVVTGGVASNQYHFVALGENESAEMNMGNYSKLEAPTYHVLLHLTIKDDVERLAVDSMVNGGTYSLDTSKIAQMVMTEDPIGMSAALKMYLLCPTDADNPVVSWDAASGAFLFNEKNLTGTAQLFDMEIKESTSSDNVVKKTLEYTGKKGMFTVDTSTLVDVDGDNYRDLFIFMTYDAMCINRLQDYATQKGVDMGSRSIAFESDFSLYVRKELVGQ